ncbi:uncharacterized protein LOC144435229 [Glandiceps talaboti]
MVLVLQVIGKLNSELAYARIELDRATKGDGGDAAAARKKVVWLEDRVERLLTRHKKGVPRLSESRITLSDETESYYQYHSESQPLTSDQQTGSELELMNNQLDQSTPSMASIQFVKNIDNSDGFIDDELIPREALQSRVSSRSQRSQTAQHNTDLVTPHKITHAGVTVKSGIDTTPQREKRKKKKMKKRKEIGAGDASTAYQDASSDDDVEVQPKSILKRPHSRGEADGREDDRKSDEGGAAQRQPMFAKDFTETSVYPVRSVTTTTEEYYSDISQTDEDTQSEDGLSSEVDSKGKGDGVFITETPGTRQSGRGSHQVTVVSPRKGDTSKPVSAKSGDLDLEDLKDEASKYWKSDHHQFEYTENKEAILSMDPLSYHAMGLAVPSTFTESLDAHGTQLPWRQRRKGSDLPDVHKIALDSLAKKIHKMWGKVENAAVASTTFKTPEPSFAREATFLTNVESSLSHRPSPAKTPGSRKSNRTKSRGGATSAVESPSLLPPLEGSKQDARSRLLEYHPKPIPPAEVLSLTRTNASKKYPRISGDWNETAPEDSEPTLRIVNQMNVAKETNLLVYKSKEKKRKTHVITPVSTREASSKAGNLSRDRNQDTSTQQAAQMIAMLNGKTQKTVKLETDTLKWKRISEIMEKLYSDRVDERRDAATHLGTLKCNNDDVLLSLKEKVLLDADLKVKYEAAKSMVSLGFHDEPAIKIIIANLMYGSPAVRQDLLETIMYAKDIQYIDPEMAAYEQLVVVLKGLCEPGYCSESISFNAAICLGCLGIRDPIAKNTLLQSLDSKDSFIIAKSLEILVRQMYVADKKVIDAILGQLKTSTSWKHRAAAAKLLVYIGPTYICDTEHVDNVFDILEHRLWDDPHKEVKKEIGNALASLGMRDWIWEVVEKKLEDDSDDVRAQGAIAVGVLGIKTDKVVRTLLEMLELDSSEFVRLHVIRTFAQLGMTDIKIMRSMRERERTEGPLAREAGKALKILNEIKLHQVPRSPSRSPLKTPSPNLSRNMLGI